MTLHLGVMLGWGPLSRWETVTCEGKIGGGGSEQSLLPMSSHPHGLALTPWLLPVHPCSCPPLGEAVSPQMAAPSGDSCREERPGRVCLQVAMEGNCGPEGVSWVPEP